MPWQHFLCFFSVDSSAFMSLASRFPPKLSSTRKTYNGGGTKLVVKEPQVHILEPEENTEGDVKTLNQSVYDQSSVTIDSAGRVVISHSQSMVAQVRPQEPSNHTQQNFFNICRQTQDLMQKERQLDLGDQKDAVRNETNEVNSTPVKLKSRGQGKEKKDDFNWDNLRIKAQANGGQREKKENTMDCVDWYAVRRADVSEISDVIKERGMNNILAERIKVLSDYH